MDATCAIQASIHVFSLVRKYVSRILGTYQLPEWQLHGLFYVLYISRMRQQRICWLKWKCLSVWFNPSDQRY